MTIYQLNEEVQDKADNAKNTNENMAEEVSRLKVLLKNVEEEKHNIKLHLNQFLSENNDLKDRVTTKNITNFIRNCMEFLYLLYLI